MKNTITFQNNLITKARWARGWTKTQAAREVSLTRQQYCRIEAGLSGSYEALRRISFVLDIPLADLLGIASKPEKDLAA